MNAQLYNGEISYFEVIIERVTIRTHLAKNNKIFDLACCYFSRFNYLRV